MGNYNVTEITALIKKYKSLKSNSNQKAAVYEDLISHLRNFIYFMPNEKMNMDEEDCAELLLMFEGRYDNIISMYDESLGSFFSFMKPTIIKLACEIRNRRIIKYKTEKTIIESSASYEALLEEQERSIEGQFVAEEMENFNREDSIELQRLKFFLSESKKARERFYIYFFSFTVMMPQENIIKICSQLNFSYPETLKLIKAVKESEMQKIDTFQRTIDKRSSYYSKQLCAENEILLLNQVTDVNEICEYEEKIDNYKKLFVILNEKIRKNSKLITRPTLCRLFNKNDGTIAVFLYMCKNLVDWCMKADFIPENSIHYMGVSEKLVRTVIEDEFPTKKKIRKTNVFKPIKVFDVNLSLNS